LVYGLEPPVAAALAIFECLLNAHLIILSFALLNTPSDWGSAFSRDSLRSSIFGQISLGLLQLGQALAGDILAVQVGEDDAKFVLLELPPNQHSASVEHG
jgi:hypothetical protein